MSYDPGDYERRKKKLNGEMPLNEARFVEGIRERTGMTIKETKAVWEAVKLQFHFSIANFIPIVLPNVGVISFRYRRGRSVRGHAINFGLIPDRTDKDTLIARFKTAPKMRKLMLASLEAGRGKQLLSVLKARSEYLEKRDAKWRSFIRKDAA